MCEYNVMGNEHGRAFIIYDGITPAVGTTEILNEAVHWWRQFTKQSTKEKVKTSSRGIFFKTLNFKILGYYMNPYDINHFVLKHRIFNF